MVEKILLFRATSTVSTAVTPVPRLPSEITGQPVEKQPNANHQTNVVCQSPLCIHHIFFICVLLMHQSLIKAGVYDSFVKINSCINAIGHYFVVGLHGHVLALSLGL
ncbi:uncharacterized protein LOC114323589 isoform X5 [Camellia sinensis]|uniref:uncharacterized protein LOC114323589 isoform X5 n=1 Tax=Camellia sinensis TaxID=4442 RepID=UPI0010367850|nr:uncharacterized protein LOC114323589 isoform X5 [Camellia sinensis]